MKNKCTPTENTEDIGEIVFNILRPSMTKKSAKKVKKILNPKSK